MSDDDKRAGIVRHIYAICAAFLDQAPLEAPWEDARELVDACKKRAGLVLPGHDLSGRFYVRLIPLRDMSLAQVEYLHDITVRSLSDMLGEDVNRLLPPPSPVPTARKAAKAEGGTPGRKAKAPPEPAGEQAHPPPPSALDFASKMHELATDQRTTVAEKLAILKNLSPYWIEALGPGYADMVKAVVKALEQGVQGDGNVLATALRYVDTHAKYWNPNPPKRTKP